MKYFLSFRDLCISWTRKEKSFCLAFTCSCMLCLHPFLGKPFAFKTKSQMKSLLQLSHFCVTPAGKRFHYSSGLLDLFSTEFTVASNYQVKLISCSSLSLYYFTMLHHIYRNLTVTGLQTQSWYRYKMCPGNTRKLWRNACWVSGTLSNKYLSLNCFCLVTVEQSTVAGSAAMHL